MVENRSMASDAVATQSGHPKAGALARIRVDAPSSTELIPVVVLLSGLLLTILSFESHWIDLALRLPRMHAVIDTAIGLTSLLLAYLVYGPVQALGRQRDVTLAFALGFGGLVNIFSAVTQGVHNEPLGR